MDRIPGMRLLDNELMELVFDGNIEATEFLLNIILQRDDMKVIEVVGQKEYQMYQLGGYVLSGAG